MDKDLEGGSHSPLPPLLEVTSKNYETVKITGNPAKILTDSLLPKYDSRYTSLKQHDRWFAPKTSHES